MQKMGAYEAKTHFSSLLEQVEQGKDFLITKHGHPVAKLISVKSNSRQYVHRAIQRLTAFREMQSLDGLDWRVLRDEGRR